MLIFLASRLSNVSLLFQPSQCLLSLGGSIGQWPSVWALQLDLGSNPGSIIFSYRRYVIQFLYLSFLSSVKKGTSNTGLDYFNQIILVNDVTHSTQQTFFFSLLALCLHAAPDVQFTSPHSSDVSPCVTSSKSLLAFWHLILLSPGNYLTWIHVSHSH